MTDAKDKAPACRQSTETLSAFVDGDLPPAEAQSVRAHAAGCPRCTLSIGELRAVLTAARGLERPEPPPTLWAAVEGALDEDYRHPHDRPWWMSLRLFGTGALAGAAAVSLLALGLSSWRTHHAAERAAAATPAALAAAPTTDPLLEEAEAEFARAAATYEKSIEKLRGLLAREEPRWSPTERARCAERLAQLDEAIATSREAARKSPGDGVGNEQLFALYQQKIAFLAEAVHRGGTFRQSGASDSSEPSP
ncbi:MAG TPA: zf-HC2 domain-containing protein [Polyangia bacterium]|jgi:tetratricopeptide (TPR) repeat protein